MVGCGRLRAGRRAVAWSRVYRHTRPVRPDRGHGRTVARGLMGPRATRATIGKPSVAVGMTDPAVGDQRRHRPVVRLALTLFLGLRQVAEGRLTPPLDGHDLGVLRDVAGRWRGLAVVAERGRQRLEDDLLVGAERSLLPAGRAVGRVARDRDAGGDRAPLVVHAQLDGLQPEAVAAAAGLVAVLGDPDAAAVLAVRHLQLDVRRGAQAAVAAGALGQVLPGMVDDDDVALAGLADAAAGGDELAHVLGRVLVPDHGTGQRVDDDERDPAVPLADGGQQRQNLVRAAVEQVDGL